jgi:hypothetical protein
LTPHLGPAEICYHAAGLDDRGARRREFAMGRFRLVTGLVREFVLFLKEDRTWWLVPIVVALLGLSAFVVFAQGSALAPFIYALF